MAPPRKPEAPPQARKQRGNDEQEPDHPYGGDHAGHPPSKDEYLQPNREDDVATDLKRSGGKAAETPPPRRSRSS